MAEWKGKTRGGAFGYRFFVLLIRKCGLRVAYTFLCIVLIHFIPFAPKATHSTWIYARRILKRSWIGAFFTIIRSYYMLGQILIDKIAIGNGMQSEFSFKFDHYQEFLDILNANTGAVIIGAHVGNWEIGAPFFDDYGKKMNIVLYDAEYQKIKKILEQNTAAAHYKIIPVNRDNLSHVFSITAALNAKEYVCFQGDRFLNEEKRLEATFMEHKAYFPLGPFLLASRLNVPVVFYFAMREPGRTYRFHFTIAKPIVKERGKKAEQALLQQYLTALESVVKRYPTQWFNYYRFWHKSKAA